MGDSSVVTRNTPLLISEVGVGDGGLVCRTDHPQCCDSSTDAVWLSPNNTVISSNREDSEDFYTTRGDGYITLNRYSSTTSAAGMYCCVIPVSGGSTEIFCAVLTLRQGIVTSGCMVCFSESLLFNSIVSMYIYVCLY